MDVGFLYLVRKKKGTSQYALEHSFQKLKGHQVEMQTLLLFILILTWELRGYKLIVTRS